MQSFYFRSNINKFATVEWRKFFRHVFKNSIERKCNFNIFLYVVTFKSLLTFLLYFLDYGVWQKDLGNYFRQASKGFLSYMYILATRGE